MIKILIIIFVLLSLVAGGNKTAKAIMTTAINISIFALLIELIYLGFNISISTIIAVLLITAVTIFYQNDRNIKTKSAFMSVILVLSIS
ncbi:YibE/F family protein, partial [Mogibacterium timidum]